MDYNLTDSRTSQSSGITDAFDPHSDDLQDQSLGQRLMSEVNFSQSAGSRDNSNKQGAKMSIENEGSIASASLDKGWSRGASENSALQTVTSFRPGDNSATISMIKSEIQMNKEDAKVFHDLLANHANGEYKLSADEIKSLGNVMNRLNAGDNQFTNSAPAGDRYAPNFHVDNCRIQQVNNKPVLVVEGNFVNSDGTAGAALKGVLIDRDGNGQKIQGLTLEAADRTNLQRNQSTFDNMIQSIRWNK